MTNRSLMELPPNPLADRVAFGFDGGPLLRDDGVELGLGLCGEAP